jgi:hypothetical protein
MRECLCARTEAHSLAEIVAALFAEIAISALYACLDGNTLADDEVCDTGTDMSDDASSFVTEHKWCTNGEITIAAVNKVVEV